MEEIVSSWDCTFKGTDGTDFVCGLAIGRIGANKYVLARTHDRMNLPDTIRALRRMKADFPEMYEHLIEDKANGPAVCQLLGGEISGLIAVNPEGGKEVRAAAIEPQIEAGNVYLPEGAEWLGEFIDEFASFPKGKHDDQVDALSQALVRWHDGSEIHAARLLLGLTG
jgi:predicted phage terminase large subunit-like protein